MKILVVGSGGREHTLTWKISQSPMVTRIFCAPGNAGTAALAENVDIKADDIDGLAAFAAKNSIDLTVVGPEAPLVNGIVDVFEEKGLSVFGPSKAAARLEGSKLFSKNHMQKYGIACATGKAFTDPEKAKTYARALGAPCVVKADGLAAGKGVIVCTSLEEAESAIDDMLEGNAFGDAGALVLVEECLKGEEASFICLTDGKTVLPLPESQDHKRIFDNDEGPNTGGMGAYSPAPVLDHYLRTKAMKEVMIPAVEGMAKEGTPFKGVLYAGLMVEQDRIKVLEFNTRLGDPETQPILMRLQNDLVPLMEACCDGTLHLHTTKIDPRAAMCVVISSGGYPGSYETGNEITGLDEAAKVKDTVVFHAGTALDNGKVVSAGGRVLGVTALGDGVEDAIKTAYEACAKISFKDCFMRKDIGAKALRRMAVPPQVGVIMGSDSDFPVMEKALAMLKKFDIPYYVTVASAHRTPEAAATLAVEARDKGVKVLICGAGHAAHLAGVIAAHTTLPVLGVPIDSSALQGMDALLATVQMPPGIPVSTMAIGKSGAHNAGITAAQIIGVSDPEIAEKLAAFKKEMAAKVVKRHKALPDAHPNLIRVDLSVRPDDPAMTRAGEILSRNGVVIFPARCLYGIAANALSPAAVEKVFSLKERPKDNPILVLIRDTAMLKNLVRTVPDQAKILMERFWSGRLTLVFEAADHISPLLTAHTGKIGIRLPGHPVAKTLVRTVDFPITGTSANISGTPGCTNAKDLPRSITRDADLVLDAGPVQGGPGSTVVDVTTKPVKVLRNGALPEAEIFKALGR